MTASAGPALLRLHHEFADRIGFVTLYVREAHPGDRYPQPTTFEQKLRHARDYQSRDAIPWPVAVDDVEGSLHRQLDPRPHAAYVMGADGNVAARLLWANDERALRKALRRSLGGQDGQLEINNHVVPMMSGTGCMYETWEAAGGHAKTDVLREVPPVFVSGWLAARLRPLGPLARGSAAMALTMLGPAAALWAWRALRRSAP